jgi:hypothetical protein
MAFLTFRIPLPVQPVVLPLSQLLASNGTGLLLFANAKIWNKPPAIITTLPLCHLKSPLPRSKMANSKSRRKALSSPLNSPLSTNDLYTKYTNDSSVTPEFFS